MFKLFTDDTIQYMDENKDLLKNILIENEDDPTDENMTNLSYSLISDEYEQIKGAFAFFDVMHNYEKILVCADLGLWYGRRKAQKYFDSLYDCIFKFCEDTNTFYFMRKNGTLHLDAIHHDGVNKFTFYKIKKGKKYAINMDELTRGL